MDTSHKVLLSLKKGHWAYSVDLKDAYLQIPINPASRKYLQMKFQGTVFLFNSLPFGISTAPWHFIKNSRSSKVSHKNGLTVFQYLDNWLGDALSQQEAQTTCNLLVKLCNHLGFLINFQKSDLKAHASIRFRGYPFQSVPRGSLHHSKESQQGVVR